tara:strand:- start:1559 stop:2053 length:495 start_codon:yes stop_codon:yes gene_type:complete
MLTLAITPDATFTFRDRSGYGGIVPDSEPDKIVWVDEATGLDCMIHRNGMGALCGYVGVSEGHPLFKVDYYEVPSSVQFAPHGGLTFSDTCNEDACKVTGEGICHDAKPGRPEHVWWLGFDCGHYSDLVPSMHAWDKGGKYRDIGYVIKEVQALALAAAKEAEK